MERIQAESILNTLKQKLQINEIEQNSILIEDKFISLYDIIRLTKENNIRFQNQADDYKKRILNKTGYNVRIYPYPEQDSVFKLSLSREYAISSQSAKIQVIDDDLILVEKDDLRDSKIMQQMGNELLSYYKDILISNDVIHDFKFLYDAISIEWKIDYGYVDSQLLITIYGVKSDEDKVDYDASCSISINVDNYSNNYDISCDSLKVVNFMKENMESLLHNIFVPKYKCPDAIINMLKKQKMELQQGHEKTEDNKKTKNGFIKALVKKLKRH